MKIQIASDLHLEFLADTHPQYKIIEQTDADVLVLAGDIHTGTRAQTMFEDNWAPIVYVAGNHEFYRRRYQSVRTELDQHLSAHFHYLENNEWIHQGVRFLGCTMWTDYMLYNNPVSAMRTAASDLNDHKVIKHEGSHRRFMPADALALHQRSRAWLEHKLSEAYPGKTVVVTHHCPSHYSVAAQYSDDPLSAAFVSDLSALMGEDRVTLWIHGHTHTSFDYTLRDTRVVCNPCGYPKNPRVRDMAALEFENSNFNRRLVVEI